MPSRINNEKIGVTVAFYPGEKFDKFTENIENLFGKIFKAVQRVTQKEIKRFCSSNDSCALLIVDCRKNGSCLELVHHVRESLPLLKLLAVYDRESREYLPDLYEKGVDYFLPVPWHSTEVRRVLKPVVEWIVLSRRLHRCHDELFHCRQRCDEGDTKDRENEAFETMQNFFRFKSEEMSKHLLEAVNMISLLLQEKQEDRQKEFLSRVDHALGSLSMAVDEIRNYLGVDSESDRGIRRIFNINSVLESSGKAVLEKFEVPEMDLVFEMDRSVPSKMKGDPVTLGEVLTTLLEALFELDGEGETLLQVTMEPENSDGKGAGRILRFDLSCSGKFPFSREEILKRLKQDSRVTKAMARLARIGGSLYFPRNEETNELVRIILPIFPLERRSYHLPFREWMNKSMLIVDGNDTSASALEQMLSYFHFYIERVGSIDDALKHLYLKSYDLIFLKEDMFERFIEQGSSIRREAGLVLVTRDEKSKKINPEIKEQVDAYLSLPFTQQKIFDLLLDIYAKDKLSGTQETLEILVENLNFLMGGKSVLYFGKPDSDLLMIQELLKNVNIVTLRSDSIESLEGLVSRADLIILDDRWDEDEWERLFGVCDSLCRRRPVFVLVHGNNNLQKIERLKSLGIEDYLHTPIEPEEFYRLLIDRMIERGSL